MFPIGTQPACFSFFLGESLKIVQKNFSKVQKLSKNLSKSSPLGGGVPRGLVKKFFAYGVMCWRPRS